MAFGARYRVDGGARLLSPGRARQTQKQRRGKKKKKKSVLDERLLHGAAQV